MSKPLTRWTLLPILFLAMGVLLALAPKRVEAQDSPPSEESAAQLFTQSSAPIPPFTPGVVLVGLQGEVTAASATWGELEVIAVEPLDLRTGEVGAAGSEAITGYKLSVPVGTEWEAIETLSAREDVVFAEPDWLAQIAQDGPVKASAETPFFVSDTLYQEQWYLQRIGMSRAWSVALAESGATLATIEVAVIDTGVDFAHPDLADRVAAGHNYLDSTKTAMDDNGHGTHISGLIAATMNGAGMVGPAREVEIIPFKTLNQNGLGGVSAIGQAIRDAADDGVDIINMSLELSLDTFVLRSAVQYAVSQGVFVIAASGNQNRSTVSFPAAYPSVMAVGATTYLDVRAFYSNRGPELDIVAPGGSSGNSILSSWTRDVGAVCPSGPRQVNGGLYCLADGTSMATGIASGVAALIMSLRPDLNADQVQAIILDTATPIAGTASEVGRGRLDAARALRRALLPQLLFDNPIVASAKAGEAPFAMTVPLENPSLEPLAVEVTSTSPISWYNVLEPRAGEASYGAPMEVQLLFSPTTVGTYASSLRITTTAEDGGKAAFLVSTQLKVTPAIVGGTQHFMPWTGGLPGDFQWAEPSYTERTNYTVSGDGSIVVDLPFTMTVNEREYTDLRIFADGFVVASASAMPANLPNHCLANQIWPAFAVYGWWSSLNLGADSVLSTFQPDADRFVIEYARFISMDSSDPDDRVSFQIILQRNGQVGLNYGQVPEHDPEQLTVGVSVEDGRFYNQVTCHTGPAEQIGEVPDARQSFIFHSGDLY